ncbi:MAG: molybdenum cofactor biosynthesis protein MoaE [Candidatus Bathyarchaeota archaeon]|nr:molybdenum cofactor biosynthesis protein MoaE [Candidatus Bathyarchaeota archaeon]
MTAKAGVHPKGTVTIQNVIDNIKQDPTFQKAGTISCFIGVVRGETFEDKKVQKLTIQGYEEKAREVLTQICSDLTKKTGIVAVQIHHFLGEFDVGEDLVYVAVAGAHREEVFAVLHEAVERYKHEVPIFKKEHIIDSNGKSSGYWVSEKEHQP